MLVVWRGNDLIADERQAGKDKTERKDIVYHGRDFVDCRR